MMCNGKKMMCNGKKMMLLLLAVLVSLETLYAEEEPGMKAYDLMKAQCAKSEYQGLNPLQYAALVDNASAILFMVKNPYNSKVTEDFSNNKFDIDQAVKEGDYKGYTALHIACQNGKANAIKVLIDNGADVNAEIKDPSSKNESKKDYTPLALILAGRKTKSLRGMAVSLLLRGAKRTGKAEEIWNTKSSTDWIKNIETDLKLAQALILLKAKLLDLATKLK